MNHRDATVDQLLAIKQTAWLLRYTKGDIAIMLSNALTSGKLSPEQRAAMIEKQLQTRKLLNEKLGVLVAKRDKFVAEQQAKAPPRTSSFDRAVAETLKVQTAR